MNTKMQYVLHDRGIFLGMASLTFAKLKSSLLKSNLHCKSRYEADFTISVIYVTDTIHPT